MTQCVLSIIKWLKRNQTLTKTREHTLIVQLYLDEQKPPVTETVKLWVFVQWLICEHRGRGSMSCSHQGLVEVFYAPRLEEFEKDVKMLTVCYLCQSNAFACPRFCCVASVETLYSSWKRLGLEQLDLLEKQAPADTSDSASFRNCSAVNVKVV